MKPKKGLALCLGAAVLLLVAALLVGSPGRAETVQEAMLLTNAAVAEALDGLPPVKVHCSVLAEEAIKSALEDYYKRQGKDPADYMVPVSQHCEACCQEEE